MAGREEIGGRGSVNVPGEGRGHSYTGPNTRDVLGNSGTPNVQAYSVPVRKTALHIPSIFRPQASSLSVSTSKHTYAATLRLVRTTTTLPLVRKLL